MFAGDRGPSYPYDRVASRTLLLNATYEPLRVISWQRAVGLIWAEKVEMVRTYDGVLRSVSWSVAAPSVVRLKNHVRRRRLRIAMTRRNVFVRDGHRCQYCQKALSLKELTCDHVRPRSQGGPTTWENVVAACGPCNRRKGGRTPEQARMRLLKPPRRPDRLPVKYMLNLGHSPPEPWREYLEWFSMVEATAH